MRITIRQLRGIIRSVIAEGLGGRPTPNTVRRNAMSPAETPGDDYRDLEPMKFDDTADDPDELPPHLRDVVVDPDDCWGPVPPTGEDPYVIQDPYVRMSSPLPTMKGVGR